MTPRAPRRSSVALALAAAVVLGGCSEPGPALGPLPPDPSSSASADAPATPSTGTSSSTAVAAPTSAELPSAEKQALAEASEAVTDYYAAVDRINGDPSGDPDALQDVATGDAYLASVRAAARIKGRGLVQTGSARVVDVHLISVDLTHAPPGRYPTVVLDTCLDVSATDVEDTDGQSVVPADRLDRTAARLNVVHHDFGWRVHTIESSGEPCAP
ncbi:hypothetical protein [Modestobacter sp. SSW1-42]|uniref:hypothetical protein n=1 Tax=Modestobacter sp. SSW1-42 TaxID=596372 RepID=UPI003986AECA